MDKQALSTVASEMPVLTTRDLARPLFRHRRAAVRLFAAMMLVVVGVVYFWPDRYRAEMKILVKHERIDPVLSPDRDTPRQTRLDVSESELYSEVELLKSRDLLEAVAIEARLVETTEGKIDPAALSRAVRALHKQLTVAPARKTTLIDVTYSSRDPQQAAQVLSILARRYLEKHLEVHRLAGSREFFADQTERLRTELRSAERRLLEFGQQHQIVSAATEKESTLQQLAAFESAGAQLRAQITDAHRRLDALRQQAANTPQRQTTALRTLDNGELMHALKTKVLDLEIRHTEMQHKFAATYPPVIELEAQLAQAREALAAAEKTPLREETTDQNPTHQWIQGEMARVEAEAKALQGRLATTIDTVRRYRAKADKLDADDSAQQELIRTVRAAEESYMLYKKKAEEARIADALDRSRISNVALAEPPTTPALPSNSNRVLLLLVGLSFSLAASVAATFVMEFLNPHFRTREEIHMVLDLPVLAAIPASTRK